MTSMCAWSDCQKDAMVSLTGEYGMGGSRARNGFCCFEHLIAFSLRRLALPAIGVGYQQELDIMNRVQNLLEEIRKPPV